MHTHTHVSVEQRPHSRFARETPFRSLPRSAVLPVFVIASRPDRPYSYRGYASAARGSAISGMVRITHAGSRRRHPYARGQWTEQRIRQQQGCSVEQPHSKNRERESCKVLSLNVDGYNSPWRSSPPSPRLKCYATCFEKPLASSTLILSRTPFSFITFIK